MATINDIVLIYMEDTPISFARVESILPDHKKDWYQIKLLMLQIPLQVVTWILKDDYINGTEFHMNQKKMKLEKVVCPPDELLVSQTKDTENASESDSKIPQTPPENQKDKTPPEEKENSRIISFSDLKRKNDKKKE